MPLSDQAVRLYNALASANAWPYGAGGGPLQDELVAAGILTAVPGGYGPSGLTPAAYAAQQSAPPPVASGASSGGSPVQTVTSPVVYTPAPATTTAVPGDTTQSGIDRNVLIGAGIVGIGALLLLRR